MDGRGDTGWPATIGSPWLINDGLLAADWRSASMASACAVPGVGASSCAAAAAAALADAAISVAFSPAQPTTPLTVCVRKPHEAPTSAGRGATPCSAASEVAAEVEEAAEEAEAAAAGSSGPAAPRLTPCASAPRLAVSVAPSETRL